MKCYNTSLYKITFYIFLLVCFLSFYIASIIFLPTIFFCYTTYSIVIYSIFRNSGQPSEQCWNPHASFPQFNKYIYQGFYKHICTFYNGLISSQSSSVCNNLMYNYHAYLSHTGATSFNASLLPVRGLGLTASSS